MQPERAQLRAELERLERSGAASACAPSSMRPTARKSITRASRFALLSLRCAAIVSAAGGIKLSVPDGPAARPAAAPGSAPENSSPQLHASQTPRPQLS